MDTVFCARCGAFVEGEGVVFTGRVFCSDACCERFESMVTTIGEPTADELENSYLEDCEILDVLEDLDDGFDSALNDC